jgi:hypothetical protein
VRSWRILNRERIKVAEFLRGAKFRNKGVFSRIMLLPIEPEIDEEDVQFAAVEPKHVNFVSDCQK